MKGNNKIIIYWLWSGIFLVTLMVMIGGITRLTGSGLSMVSWKVISGTIPPLGEEQWNEAFEEYKQFPEYQKLNYRMTLPGFKKIFWWEYTHRLIGRLTGLIFIIPFLYFLIRRKLSGDLIRELTIILFLGMAQGVMGWIMVKSGLQDNPHVSHYRLAMHLSLALLLIGSILWLILRLSNKEKTSNIPLHKSKLTLPILCLLLLFVQIVLGAFVAGLKAGYSYNTYPLMNNALLPAGTFDYPVSLFENGVFIQFIHRWFAWIVAGAIFVLCIKTRSALYPAKALFYANLLLAVCFLQILAGIATLVFSIPLALGVLHQLIAVLLFCLTVTTLFYLKHSPAASAPGNTNPLREKKSAGGISQPA